jgi:hypothetical protein
MRDIRLPPEPPLPPRKLTGSSVPVSTSSVPEPIVSRRPLGAAQSPKRQARSAVAAPRLGQRERALVGGFLLLLVIAGALAAILFLPSASIKLVLRTAPLLVDEKITIAASGAPAATGTSSLPGSMYFRELEIDGSSPVTSTEVIGKKARGTVQLINRTFDEQKIVDKSRLVTKDGELFYIQTSVTIPPATGGSLSSVLVEVEAAEAGEGGNIDPQRLDFAALPPASQALVYAEAKTNITGGSGETVPIVKAEDIAAARESAGVAARSKIEPDVRGELPGGWSLLDESWSAEILSFDTPVAEGAREAAIPYKARVKLRVLGYETQSLEEHLRQTLEANIDEEYALFPGAISFTTAVDNVNWDTGEATIAARVTHTTIADLSLPTLREKLAGRSEAEARQYLENLPGVSSVSLDLSPFWVNSIPRIQKRINLDLTPERQP